MNTAYIGLKMNSKCKVTPDHDIMEAILGCMIQNEENKDSSLVSKLDCDARTICGQLRNLLAFPSIEEMCENCDHRIKDEHDM